MKEVSLMSLYRELESEYLALEKTDYSKEKLKGYKDCLWDLSIILKEKFSIYTHVILEKDIKLT